MRKLGVLTLLTALLFAIVAATRSVDFGSVVGCRNGKYSCVSPENSSRASNLGRLLRHSL